MQLYQNIVRQLLESGEYKHLFSKQNISLSEIVELKCYQTLCEIKKVLEDDTLNDEDCFERIEQIVVIFEELGSGIEYRHDFG